MTRTECEATILRKMIEIEEIYKEYNPNGNYLTMCILDGHYSVRNDSRKEDKDHPLDAWYRPNERKYPYSYSEGIHFDLETGEVIEDAT